MNHYKNSYPGTGTYDRWSERNQNRSTMGKVQKQFWFTKSAMIRKLGKKEDEHIVASDAELDAKIDLFKAIESSTRELQVLLAEYQSKICFLAQEEGIFGHLLKEFGKEDNSRAGKIMNAVGKSLSYTAQQRVALRNPLVRLFQEVDTFHSRAVEDTAFTVSEMEKYRTEYRGALMWMKNVSKDFNPDHYDQLEKFREVQATVKQKKTKFDALKVKTIQKIDLLAASRCNMFSHALIVYQNNLITFCDKTAKAYNTVASNFKGYQPYKFQVIKELADPYELLNDETNDKNEDDLDKDDQTFFQAEYHDEKHKAADKEAGVINSFSSETKNDHANIEEVKNTDRFDSPNDFSNIDLLSSIVDRSNANESMDDILKGILESPERKPANLQQTLPVFGCDFLSDFSAQALSKDKESNLKKTAFMPSQLLDFGFDNPESKLVHQNYSNSPLLPSNLDHQTIHLTNEKMVHSSHANQLNAKNTSEDDAKQVSDKLDWYKVFQDIDPLADPGSLVFGKVEDKQC